MKRLAILTCTILFLAGCGCRDEDAESATEQSVEKTNVVEQAVQPQASNAAAPTALSASKPELAKEEEKDAEDVLVQPETFEETLLVLNELEQDARFGDAIVICRKALAETQDTARMEILKQIMQRLVLEQNEALELSFAAESLSKDKGQGLSIARQKLKEGGQTGRILLRKAVRAGDEKAVAEAGAILVELDDKYVPSIFIERLRANPPGPVVAALVEILRQSRTEVDCDLIAELCDLASREGPTRMVLVNMIMNSLEQSVTLPPPPKEGQGDKPVEQPPPDYGKLPARVGNLAPVIVETLISFLEQYAVRPENAPALTPEETAALARAEKILVQSGFACTSGMLVNRFVSDPAAPVAKLVLRLLKQMTPRLDDEDRERLAAYVTKGGVNRTGAVLLLMDSLESMVTPAPPADKPDQKMPPEPEKIPSLLGRTLGVTVSGALIAYVEKQTAPGTANAPKPTAEETAALARVSKLLVESRFPGVPGMLIDSLLKDPAPPTVKALDGLLKQMTAGFDSENQHKLAAYVAKGGVNRTVAVSLLMDSLESLVTPAPPADKPDQKMPPALEKIPPRLGRTLGVTVSGALIAYVEKQTAPGAADAPKPTAEETAALARVSKLLVESRFPGVPRMLIDSLLKDPAPPTVKALDGLLKQMPSRFDGVDREKLAAYVAKGGANCTAAVSLFMDSLESLVTPAPPADKPDQKMLPEPGMLPSRLGKEQQASVAKALIAYIEKQSAPKAKDAPAVSPDETAAFGRAEKMLVQSGLPQAPNVVVDRIVANPGGPAVKAFVKILTELSDRLDSEAIAKLSGVAASDTPGKEPVTSLVIHILSKPGK